MSKFEIILTVLGCCIPIVSMLLLLPKKKPEIKKGSKDEVKPSKSVEEIKKEEPKVVEEVKQEATTKSGNSFNELSEKDFENYLDFKKRTSSKPKHKDLPENFVDNSMPFERYQQSRNKEPEQKQSLNEKITSLDPTIKAMIIAGILDRKDYD